MQIVIPTDHKYLSVRKNGQDIMWDILCTEVDIGPQLIVFYKGGVCAAFAPGQWDSFHSYAIQRSYDIQREVK